MKIYHFDKQNISFVFYVECKDTRHGFKHIATATLEDHEDYDRFDKREHTCYYLNRTWEYYTGQSAILGVCRDAIDEEIARAKNDFMFIYGYERMTAKRREQFKQWIDDGVAAENTTLRIWCDAYAAFHGSYCEGYKTVGYGSAAHPQAVDFSTIQPSRFVK